MVTLCLADIFDGERDRYSNEPHCFKDKKVEIIHEFLYKAKEYIHGSEFSDRLTRSEFTRSQFDAYSRSIYNRLTNENDDYFPEDIRFQLGDTIYTYLDYSPINIEHEHYPFFFFIKLSQGDRDIFRLKTFLTEHYQEDYQSDHSRYVSFLKDILLNFEDLLPEKVKQTVIKWLSQFDEPQPKLPMQINSEPATISTEETMAYKAAVFYFIMLGAGINFRNSDFNTSMAVKCLHILFNKNYTAVQNSDFHKFLKKAPTFLDGVSHNLALLEKVRDEFASKKLNDIVKIIDEVIIQESNLKKNKQL